MLHTHGALMYMGNKDTELLQWPVSIMWIIDRILLSLDFNKGVKNKFRNNKLVCLLEAQKSLKIKHGELIYLVVYPLLQIKYLETIQYDRSRILLIFQYNRMSSLSVLSFPLFFLWHFIDEVKSFHTAVYIWMTLNNSCLLLPYDMSNTKHFV